MVLGARPGERITRARHPSNSFAPFGGSLCCKWGRSGRTGRDAPGGLGARPFAKPHSAPPSNGYRPETHVQYWLL